MVGVKHLWFDPGGTTGWALYEDARPLQMGEAKSVGELVEACVVLIPMVDRVGCENYRLRPKGMKQGYTPMGDEVHSIRRIGTIEAIAYQNEKQVIFQEPDIKPAGYGYAGLPPYDPNKKGMHMQDALAHGAFFYMETYQSVRRATQR